MKNLSRIGLLAMLVMVLLLAVGCDEDDPAGPTEKQTGDLNDPEFQQMMASMDAGELYISMLQDDIFDVIDAVFAGGLQGVSGDRQHPVTVTGVDADSVYLVYHETSQYWYWYLQAIEPSDADTLTVTIIDSVQFLHVAGPVQWPDSALVTGIRTGALLHMISTLGNEIEAAQLLTVMGDIVDKGDITLNGTQSIDMSFVADSCAVIMDLGTSANAVVMNLAHVDSSGCPESGAFSHQGTMGIACTGQGGLNFSDSWTVVQTFTGNDTFSVVAENTTTRWRYSGSCIDD
jgi:hypothetical protein